MGDPYKRYLKAAALRGALYGGLAGAVHGRRLADDKNKKNHSKKNKVSALKYGLVGLGSGAAAGGLLGYGAGKLRLKIEDKANRRRQEEAFKRAGGKGDWNYQHYKPKHGGVDQHLKFMGLGKDVTHKKQVTDRLRELVKKHHPDAPGGNHKKMQDVNDAYDNIKKSEWFSKLAFVRGFMKVAGV